MRRSNYLAMLVASCCVASAGAADYSSTVFFGDSLTDAGTYASIVQGIYPGTGKFTTNPGLVWSENLAAPCTKSAEHRVSAISSEFEL